MLIEVNYIFLSLLLVVYSAWHYFKIKERHLLYLTLGFTSLALSAMLQMLSSTMWVYGVRVNVITLRILQLSGLALFACFTVGSIIALKTIQNARARQMLNLESTRNNDEDEGE